MDAPGTRPSPSPPPVSTGVKHLIYPSIDSRRYSIASSEPGENEESDALLLGQAYWDRVDRWLRCEDPQRASTTFENLRQSEQDSPVTTGLNSNQLSSQPATPILSFSSPLVDVAADLSLENSSHAGESNSAVKRRRIINSSSPTSSQRTLRLPSLSLVPPLPLSVDQSPSSSPVLPPRLFPSISNSNQENFHSHSSSPDPLNLATANTINNVNMIDLVEDEGFRPLEAHATIAVGVTISPTRSSSPIIPDEEPRARKLRPRTIAQQKPYTTEGLNYMMKLVKNDWQGAVVSMPKSRDLTEEEIKKKKERLAQKPKDDLDGWLSTNEASSPNESQAVNRVDVSEEDEEDETVEQLDSDEEISLLTGSQLLAREASKKRRKIEKKMARKKPSAANHRVYSITANLDGDGNHTTRKSKSVSSKFCIDSGRQTEFSSRKRKIYSSDNDSIHHSTRERRSNEVRARADSDPPSSPARAKSTKKRLIRRPATADFPADSVHQRETDTATKHSALSQRILDVSSASTSPEVSRGASVIEVGTDAEDEEAEFEREGFSILDDIPMGPEPIQPFSKRGEIKLTKKQKRMMRLTMPPLAYKLALADLEKINAERAQGLENSSDYGSGDEELLVQQVRQHNKPANVGRTRIADNDGKVHSLNFDVEAFTRGSDEDSRSSDADDSATEQANFLDLYRQGKQSEETTTNYLDYLMNPNRRNRPKMKSNRPKSANRETSSSKRKVGSNGVRRPLRDGTNQRLQFTSGSNTKDTASTKPLHKLHSLGTDEAIFSLAKSFSTVVPEAGAQRDTILRAGHVPSNNFRSTNPTSRAASTEIQPQTHEHEIWANFHNFTLDFDLQRLPFGVQLAETSFVRKGHLYSLISPATVSRPTSVRTLKFFEIELSNQMNFDEFESALPNICDLIYTKLFQPETEPVENFANEIGQVLRFIGNFVSEAAHKEISFSRKICNCTLHHFERLTARVGLAAAHKDSLASIECHVIVSWYLLDVQIRAGIDSSKIVELARSTINLLINYGLERTGQALKRVKSPDPIVDEISVDVWLGLISLALAETETFNFAITDFWQILTQAIKNRLSTTSLANGPLLGEMMCYTAMVLSCISQFSPAAGTSLATPRLTANWQILITALSVIEPAAFARSDLNCSAQAVARRDRYIRTLFSRSLLFVERWNWNLHEGIGATDLVPTLFNLLNAKKLKDLEIELEPNFAPMLLQPQELGLNAFKLDVKADTAFILLLKLFGMAVLTIPEQMNEKGKTKILSRMILRLMPTTAGEWTNSSPEITISDSILINHFSLYLMFAHFSVGFTVKYFKEAKRLISFTNLAAPHSKTEQARWNCIRAGHYFAKIGRIQNDRILVQHVIEWYASMVTVLGQEYKQIELQKRKEIGLREFERRVKENLMGMKAVGISLIIRHVKELIEFKIDPTENSAFPDSTLLDPAWTNNLLTSSIGMDSIIGLAVVEFLSTVLDLRQKAISSRTPRSTPRALEDSQDEFGLDDLDYNDPALNQALGIESEVENSTEKIETSDRIQQQDLAFAKVLQSRISPAFFALISNLYGGNSMKTSAPMAKDKNVYVQRIVECWTRCIEIMINHKLVDWSRYLGLREHSWTKISDPIGRRHVGLLFAIAILKQADGNGKPYQHDLLDIWVQSSVAHSLTEQVTLTKLVAESNHFYPLFEIYPDSAQIDFSRDFKSHRIEVIRIFLHRVADLVNPASSTADPARSSSLSKSIVIDLIRSMLTSVKDHFAAIAEENIRREYSIFVRQVLDSVRQCGSPSLAQDTLNTLSNIEASLVVV